MSNVLKRSEAAALIEGLRELLALDRAGIHPCDSNTVGDLLKQHGVPELTFSARYAYDESEPDQFWGERIKVR